METKHPIFKAYKDGKLLWYQMDAFDGNGIILPDKCDELHMYTGFEDCEGKPIYEGDGVYVGTERSGLSEGSVYQLKSGCWKVHKHDAYDLNHYIGNNGFTVSLTKSQGERRDDTKQQRAGKIRRVSEYAEARREHDTYRGVAPFDQRNKDRRKVKGNA